MRNPPPPPSPNSFVPSLNFSLAASSLHEKSAIHILPATRADIPTLIEIILSASLTNVFQFLLTPTPALVEETRKDATKNLNKTFDRGHVMILKAVDGEGEITAVAGWDKKGWGEKEKKGMGSEDKLCEGAVLFPGGILTEVRGRGKGEGERDRREELGIRCLAHFNAHLKSWAAPTKYLYLAALFTHPKHQGKGIGTALLEYGHKIADREGVPCFLIGTPVGHPFYQWKGWKDIGGLSVDLKEWVKGGKRGDAGWGTYRFWYMVRMPRTAGGGAG